MRQLEIWLADLEPVKGSEQGKIRPVVIISGDTMNSNFNVVIVCPLSSSIKYYEDCCVIKKSESNGLKSDSEVITFQIRTVSKNRLSIKIGDITANQLKEILIGLNNTLKL